MRVGAAAVAVIAVLLMGSLADVNSPGPAEDPVPASEADLRKYQDVAIEMHELWSAADADCDPDAIFALLYLITTGAVGDLVAMDHFADNPMLVDWDRDFADRYLDAYAAYHEGGYVPEPWRLAFAYADSGQGSVTQHLLLGMSAHVNYDLAFSAYTMGLPQNGLKADYDRVNDAFWNVPIPQGNEFNKRYTEGPTDQDPDQELDEGGQATVELLISWREAAWLNAVDLANADNPIQFALVAERIEAEAALLAVGLIAAEDQDGMADFQERCQNSGHPPLPAAYGGPGYGDDWFGDDPVTDHKFGICVNPGQDNQRTKYITEAQWPKYEARGATRGGCGSDPDGGPGNGNGNGNGNGKGNGKGA